jgi:hypothetical protein
MLWIWLINLLKGFGWLVLLPPKGLEFGIIDRNAQCPACGNREGSLRFTKVSFPEQDLVEAPMVQHLCSVCGASWCSLPVSIPKYPIYPVNH